ncbi:MAG: outer membrane lipoprotein carrier protein LolA [Polyangia bacterium]
MKRLALLLMLVGSAAFAAPDTLLRGHGADTLARIDLVAHETHTLSAEFTQRSKVKLFKQELVQKGRLAFKAPRQIRWQYLSPDPSLLVLDGMKATMTSPGAAPQVFDLDRDATMSAVFEQLLTFVGGGSMARAEQSYAVAIGGSDRAPVITLVPNPDAPAGKVFSRIELSFDDKLIVKQIVLTERSGDEKTIVFSKVARNVPLGNDLFIPR